MTEITSNDIQEIKDSLNKLYIKVEITNERIKPVLELIKEHQRILRGYNNTPGIVSEYRKIEERNRKIDKMFWMTGAIIGGDFIFRLWQLIVK